MESASVEFGSLAERSLRASATQRASKMVSATPGQLQHGAVHLAYQHRLVQLRHHQWAGSTRAPRTPNRKLGGNLVTGSMGLFNSGHTNTG